MGKLFRCFGILTAGYFIGRWTTLTMTGINVHEALKGDPDHLRIICKFDNLGATIEKIRGR